MLLVVFMHRKNIKRLLAGKESKINFGRSRAEKQAKMAEIEKKKAERAAKQDKDEE
jgi:hypothetical protein